MLTALAHSFPFQLVARLWDAFLFEGWKPVFRFSLSILQQFQREIETSSSFEEALSILGDIPDMVAARLDDPASGMNVDSIAQAAWGMPITTAQLGLWAKEGIMVVQEQRRKDKQRAEERKRRREKMKEESAKRAVASASSKEKGDSMPNPAAASKITSGRSQGEHGSHT